MNFLEDILLLSTSLLSSIFVGLFFIFLADNELLELVHELLIADPFLVGLVICFGHAGTSELICLGIVAESTACTRNGHPHVVICHCLSILRVLLSQFIHDWSIGRIIHQFIGDV